MKVPIQNIYYLLCFSWKYVPEEVVNVGAIPASADILNLCAQVLVNGVDYLLRRGLDQGYVLREEQTTRLRGRIQITRTVKRQTWSRPEAVCQFDELSPNVLHNQIVRTTAGLLTRALNIKSDLRDQLRTTYSKLSGIDTVLMTEALFRRVQLHRNNSYYAFLLFICRLVHSLKLPDRILGEGRFSDLISDEKTMEKVFEEFLRNFYKMKQREFKDVNSRHLTWNAKAVAQQDLNLLPEMRTDITLRSNTRTIIMDAKYYKDALQEHGKAHSENLYQLLAYLRAEGATGGPQPEGMLIYPVGDNTVDSSFIIDGFTVRLYTVDLRQHWHNIEEDLLRLLDPPKVN